MTRKTVRFSLILFAAAALTAAGLGGCSKEETAPQPVVKKAVPKAQAKAAEAAKPAEAAAKQPPVVFYSPAGKRDPFVSFLKGETKAARAGMANVPPLQRYDLGEIRFVGVIWGPKGAYALVEDPEGKGYTVIVGTKIGRGGGVVTRISQTEIFVREEFLDYTGTKVVRESSMKLQTAGGK
ncbi:MAG: pilus assembly protein PilP [Deltaproteobacteria bacterium]|nr:pilus assembly protein PilP [Deltaproteobacteria bacterium]